MRLEGVGNGYCYELGDINTDEQVILRLTLEKVIIYINVWFRIVLGVSGQDLVHQYMVL